jgi:cytochrome c peroxidase
MLRIVLAIVAVALASADQSAQAADAGKSLAELKQAYRRPATIPSPAQNATSQARVELGRDLFFDPRLSSANAQACASCHNPSFGWQDGLAVGVGFGMKPLGRHTPTILNLAWSEPYFWDGRAASLEEQALGPIQAPGEMNQPLDKTIAKLTAVPGYKPLFEAAYPGEGISPATVGKAIAAFERTVVSGKAPFDRWIEGDDHAIDSAAQRGFMLFNAKANCMTCHSGWNFTDDGFRDIGLKSEDIGRAKQVPGVPVLEHAFKTPGLRDLRQRAPYMHDGSLATLKDVIDHYDTGFVKRPSLSDNIHPLNLTDGEKQDLLAFLDTLNAENPPVTLPVLPR